MQRQDDAGSGTADGTVRSDEGNEMSIKSNRDKFKQYEQEQRALPGSSTDVSNIESLRVWGDARTADEKGNLFMHKPEVKVELITKDGQTIRRKHFPQGYAPAPVETALKDAGREAVRVAKNARALGVKNVIYRDEEQEQADYSAWLDEQSKRPELQSKRSSHDPADFDSDWNLLALPAILLLCFGCGWAATTEGFLKAVLWILK